MAFLIEFQAEDVTLRMLLQALEKKLRI